MRAEICDICGAAISSAQRRDLSGAISSICEATCVCPECYHIVINADWRSLARDYIFAQRRKAAKE